MRYTNIIDIAIKHVPVEFRDDARQAGYIGLLNGLKYIKLADNKRGYLYRCVMSEIIKEMSKLHRPFSINPKTFSMLLKFKKLKRFGQEHKIGNKVLIEELEDILSIKQWSLDNA